MQNGDVHDRQERQGKPSDQDTGTSSGDDELANSLSALVRLLEHEHDPSQLVDKIVQAAVALIPGVQEGSISVVLDRKEIRSRAASGELPLKVDAAQEETGQGPCLDAVFEHQTVRVSDLRSEQRWPEFTARAVASGARSMLSFQLYVDGDNLGALNLYAYEPDAFTDDSEHVGLLFAAHAAVAFAGAQKQDHLLRAMTTRGVIGQAMGILMERYQLTGDKAFQLLVRVSQHHNRKLTDIAEELIRTGELRGQRR